MNFLLDFHNDCTDEQINQYLQTNGCSILKTYNNYQRVYLVSAATQPPKTSLVEHVIHDDPSGINLLSTTTLQQTAHTSDVLIQEDINWWKAASLFEIDFSSDVYNHKLYGKNVCVYIFDSGIDASHPEFAGANINLFHTFDGNFTDLSGHGTAIASLISGKTCGLTNAQIKVVKIFNQGAPTLLSDLVAAFDAVLADLPNNIASVANLSWSIPRNEFIDKRIDLLFKQNCMVVAAAGNSGQPISDVTPAALDNVLTIGSYDQNFYPCNFSNYTDPIHLSLTQNSTNSGELDGWAPGEKLWVAKPGGGYGYVAGTSFSAAIHSGALAYDIDIRAVMDDGTLVPCISNEMYIVTTLSSFGRRNILTLDGQYINSRNVITTYSGTKTVSLNASVPPTNYAFVDGLLRCLPICARSEVVSISFDAPLPTGIEVKSPGFLVGTTNLLTDTDPDYKIWNYTMTLTTVTGESMEFPINISVRKGSTDLSTIPEEFIWVTALANQCAGGQPFNCGSPCPVGNPGGQSSTCYLSKFDPNCETCM